jgi:hypothetical protein
VSFRRAVFDEKSTHPNSSPENSIPATDALADGDSEAHQRPYFQGIAQPNV